MRTIEFKSVREYFRKEMQGLKPNTIRKVDDDVRFDLLRDFWRGNINQLNIRIVSVENPDESFSREITDVSVMGDYYIISWKKE